MRATGQRSAGGVSSQYQILGHLATGGMAELYIVRSVGPGPVRHMVLKRIMSEYIRNHRFVTMFLDEARLASQLRHPNIAQVHDVGRFADSHFFTMEYVHGENVRNLLHRVAKHEGRIPLEHVVAVIAGAAAGLHYAHEKRGHDGRPLDIVHRDVSPSNLMVSFDGEVKLVDFGIAKASDRMTETRSGAVKGKVSYMSPEQCTGAELDRRSDIFSLGIVLYEMATMTRLFKYGSDFETMNHIVNKPVPAPTRRRPDLPRELEEIILRALARKPADRFSTAGELQAALEGFAARQGLVVGAARLGGFVRELFGEKPLPWEQLEGGDPADVITFDPAVEHDPPTEKSRRSIGARVLSDWQPDEGEDDEDDDVIAPPVAGALGLPLPAPPDTEPAAAAVDPFNASTHVVPKDAPLGALAVPVVRAPDPDPSWRSDIDASWVVGGTQAPVRRRWWLWGSVAALTVGVGVLIVQLATGPAEEGAHDAAPVPATRPVPATPATPVAPGPVTPPGPTTPSTTTTTVAPAAAPVIDAGMIDEAPATTPETTPPSTTTTPPEATPPSTTTTPSTTPVKPRPPKPPKPPKPTVKCGDAMGIYPPCE